MKIKISQSILAKYPDLRLGYLKASNINNTLFNSDLVNDLEEITKAIREKFPNNEELSKDTLISLWREIYREFGTKPSKFRPTVESLIRRIIKGQSIPQISSAVNAYLITELKYLVPIGGHDTSNITGNIELRFSNGGEEFSSIGKEKDRLTYNGEIIYSDDFGVLTRRWNFRDCDRAKITENTTDLILVMEAPTLAISDSTLSEALQNLSNNIQKYCGGICEIGILSKSSIT
jgi:lysyl-tRNA synthetase class 2